MCTLVVELLWNHFFSPFFVGNGGDAHATGNLLPYIYIYTYRQREAKNATSLLSFCQVERERIKAKMMTMSRVVVRADRTTSGDAHCATNAKVVKTMVYTHWQQT